MSTKIHATVDALGNPTSFAFTPGQAHDLDGADPLLPKIRVEIMIADKAFDAKEPRDYDKHLYKTKHLIENFFARLEQYRAITTRYDKTVKNFLSAVYLAASVIWLN